MVWLSVSLSQGWPSQVWHEQEARRMCFGLAFCPTEHTAKVRAGQVASRGGPTPGLRPGRLCWAARVCQASCTDTSWGWVRLCWLSSMPVCTRPDPHIYSPFLCCPFSGFRLLETSEHTEFKSPPALKRFEFQHSVWRQTSHLYNHCTAGAVLGITLGSKQCYLECTGCSTTKFWFSPQPVESSLDAFLSSLNRNLKHNLNFPPVKLGRYCSLG